MLEFLDQRPPVCPQTLLRRAKSGQTRPRVAVANAGAPLPMAACKEATEAELVWPVLIGNRDQILREAEALDWDIETFELVEANGEFYRLIFVMTILPQVLGQNIRSGNLPQIRAAAHWRRSRRQKKLGMSGWWVTPLSP